MLNGFVSSFTIITLSEIDKNPIIDLLHCSSLQFPIHFCAFLHLSISLCGFHVLSSFFYPVCFCYSQYQSINQSSQPFMPLLADGLHNLVVGLNQETHHAGSGRLGGLASCHSGLTAWLSQYIQVNILHFCLLVLLPHPPFQSSCT